MRRKAAASPTLVPDPSPEGKPAGELVGSASPVVGSARSASLEAGSTSPEARSDTLEDASPLEALHPVMPPLLGLERSAATDAQRVGKSIAATATVGAATTAQMVGRSATLLLIRWGRGAAR